MLSMIRWMKENYYLKRNPFPQDAILREGSDEPSENGSIFNPGVNKNEVNDFYEKFVLRPTMNDGSGFGALWSLGAGEGARGFGKTSLGQFGCKSVNKLLAKDILTSLGMEEEETKKHRVLASFGSFDKNNVTSFSSVGFEHVIWLSQAKERFYPEKSPLENLRDRIVRELNVKEQLEPGTEEESDAIISRIEDARLKFHGKELGPLSDDFLQLLAQDDIMEVRKFLKNVSVWNRMRNGFSYLDAAVTFAKAAGINKVVLFVDQVEDFASTTVSKTKRVKEVERFRDIVEETAPFSSMVYYVLTMHPRAQAVIADDWDEARLPSLGLPPPDGGEFENANRVQVLRGVRNDAEANELFTAYLNDAEYRVEGAPDNLHPFTEDAISVIRERYDGRPGFMLRAARTVLESAAAKEDEIIDEVVVERILGGKGVEEEEEAITRTAREKGLSKSLR